MLPVSSVPRRGGEGERSMEAIDRDEGGAGRACDKFGRDRWRGIFPPGVGVKGSFMVGESGALAGDRYKLFVRSD